GGYFGILHVNLIFEIPIWITDDFISLSLELQGSTVYSLPETGLHLPLSLGGFLIEADIPATIDRSNFVKDDFTVIEVDLSGEQPTKDMFIDFHLDRIGSFFTLENVRFRNTIQLNIPFDYPLGDTNLVIRLVNSDYVIITEISQRITVIEQVNIQIKTDPLIIKSNETVTVEFFTYREDNKNPHASTVTIFLPNTKVAFSTFNTSDNGLHYVNYEFNIQPDYFDILIEPFNPINHLQGQKKRWNFRYVTSAEILVDFYTIMGIQGETIELKALIATNSMNSPHGKVILKDSAGLILAEYPIEKHDQSIIYSLFIDHQRGQYHYYWEFYSAQYLVARKKVTLLVYSPTQFVNVASNTTNVMKGQGIYLHGYLTDIQGNKLNVQTQIELLTINNTGRYRENITTESDGEFAVLKRIPEDFDDGIQFYVFQFHGDENLYLLEAKNAPLLEIDVQTAFGINFYGKNTFKINELFNVTIRGNPNHSYNISYKSNTTEILHSWLFMAEVTLDSLTAKNITLQIPSTAGIIDICLQEIATGKFIFYPIRINREPIYTLTHSNYTFAYQPLNFTVFSNDDYRVKIDGKFLFPSEVINSGLTIFNQTFTPGNHLLQLEFSNDFLTHNVVNHPLTIYQNLMIEVNTETRLNEGESTPVNILVSDTLKNPISTIHVQIITKLSSKSYEQILAEGLTNENGYIQLIPQLLGSKLIIKIKELPDYFIKEQIFNVTSIKRKLIVKISKNQLSFQKNELIDLNFEIRYRFSEIPAIGVPVNVSIKDKNEILKELTAITDQTGQTHFIFPWNHHSGVFQLHITFGDDRHIPYSETSQLLIVEENEIDLINISFVIIPILILMLGTLSLLRRKG
ncbi:MAG: hypothetical protein ACXAC7_22425, partial [Candidatus Hodarchaeales archaeon]